MTRDIALLPGDGIGPEVTRAAERVLKAVSERFRFQVLPFGGSAIDAFGEPLPPSTLASCEAADAILLGAIGGPKWDDAPVRPEAGLLGLRQRLGLFANLRPIQPIAGLAEETSPLKPAFLQDVDLLVVRELTGGIYFGKPRTRTPEGGEECAVDTAIYRTAEIRRVAELAFRLAQDRSGRVTSIDKANVLATSQLWRDVVNDVHASYAHVHLEHQLVDSAAMRLITNASSFDVVLCGNLFGDILSDEAAVLAGSLGLIPSASLGEGSRGLYEPIHGSAPDLAGRGIANPVGTILSAALMLRHSLGLSEEAKSIETAVRTAVLAGTRTPDLGGTASTEDLTRAVISHME